MPKTKRLNLYLMKLDRLKVWVLLALMIVVVILASGMMVSHWVMTRAPMNLAKVNIEGQVLEFDPVMVRTLRPDIFKPGHFSVFDVLVHLNETGLVNLEYHFDSSMNTHVIDSLNDSAYWWYHIYYDGGWWENNVFRPDHYPWKEGSTLRFFKTGSSYVENFHAIFRNEVTRRKNNSGAIIIPKVVIKGATFTKEFQNIEVTPHNLRNDILVEDLVTAIDVIMTLGDQEKISYDLEWYESIGSANIVKSYWVESIDSDRAYGRCGFVYEAGSYRYRDSAGNHIHLPADVRVLNSPEYIEFFWICI